MAVCAQTPGRLTTAPAFLPRLKPWASRGYSVTNTEQIATAFFGDDADQALYRALWVSLADGGHDDRDRVSPDWFRRYCDSGGYPHTISRLDPIANPNIVSILRDFYYQPDAGWDTLQELLEDDPNTHTIWDPVTGHVFWVSW